MENISTKNTEWIDNRLWIYDTLPPGFDSWLKFYDKIPDKYSEAKTIEYIRVYQPEQLMAVFSVIPTHRNPSVDVVHSIRKEYLLARVAELLLPARMSVFELDSLRRNIYVQGTSNIAYEEIG